MNTPSISYLRFWSERNNIEKTIEYAKRFNKHYLIQEIRANSLPIIFMSIPMIDAFVTEIGVVPSKDILTDLLNNEEAWTSGLMQRCIDLREKHQINKVNTDDLIRYFQKGKQDKKVLLSRIQLLFVDKHDEDVFVFQVLRQCEARDVVEVFSFFDRCPTLRMVKDDEWPKLREIVQICEASTPPQKVPFGFWSLRGAIEQLVLSDTAIGTKLWWLKRLLKDKKKISCIPDCAIIFYILVGKEDPLQEDVLFNLLSFPYSAYPGSEELPYLFRYTSVYKNPVFDALKLWWMHLEGQDPPFDLGQKIVAGDILMTSFSNPFINWTPHTSVVLKLLIGQKWPSTDSKMFGSVTSRLKTSQGPEEIEAEGMFEQRKEHNQGVADRTEEGPQILIPILKQMHTHPIYDFAKKYTVERKVVLRALERVLLKDIHPTVLDKLPPELWKEVTSFLTTLSSPIRTTKEQFQKLY